MHVNKQLFVSLGLIIIVLAGCGSTNSATITPADGPTPPATQAGSPPTVTSIEQAQPTAAPTTSDAERQHAAVQTIVAYYQAINQQQYATAYALWADNGAASGQTSEQFTTGFSTTVQVNIAFGTPIIQPDQVEVPVTLISVANNSDGSQRVEQYAGSYVLQSSASGATPTITSANLKPSNDELPPVALRDPVEALQAYYAAINQHALAAAYTFWGNNGTASGQTYPQFAQGFATTDQVSISLGQPQQEGAAGSVYATVPTVVVATQRNGNTQSFCGTYMLRRLNVPPFDQLGWHIEQASVQPVANVAPNSPAAQQLLQNGCQ